MAVKMERERDQNGRLTAGAKKWKAGVYIVDTNTLCTSWVHQQQRQNQGFFKYAYPHLRAIKKRNYAPYFFMADDA